MNTYVEREGEILPAYSGVNQPRYPRFESSAQLGHVAAMPEESATELNLACEADLSAPVEPLETTDSPATTYRLADEKLHEEWVKMLQDPNRIKSYLVYRRRYTPRQRRAIRSH